MTKKPSTGEVVLGVMSSQSELTAPEIAAAAKLGRSTVARALVELERSGKVRRGDGGRDGTRRLPDRWMLRSVRASSRKRAGGERLRPGQLDELVLRYLQKHMKDLPLGPTAVARGLGRSSGAVGNCLARLAAARRVTLVSERPRRYATSRPR
jgi:IclR helix-turn-helix domain